MKRFLTVLLLLLNTAMGVNSQMLEQWASKYNGPEGYDDFVSDIAVDALGNVYVTGYSLDSITGQTDKIDYATVKYNSSGIQEWASTYNGPADMMDFAHSIGIDANGNVYVTGGSMGTDTTEEWATVKYNAFGVQLWVQSWHGLPGSGHNRAIDMVVDAFGNAYVTGYGETTTLDDIDYVTIKYNTDGVQEWISTYTKIPNYPSGSDVATSIAMDNNGNIFVTGSSYDTVTRGQWDIATVKYNPAGEQQWVSRHPGATVTYLEGPQIITDNLGNACVAGGYGGYNVRYNSDGEQQTLENPYGFRSTDLAVDLSGNFYITGNTYGSPYKTTTIKYNTEGDSVWSRSFNNINSNPQLAFDNCLGYIYVTATAYDIINLADFLTIRYNSIGDSLFSIRYNAQEITSDVSVAIAVDDMANVYVAGYSGADQWSQQDIVTVKYTPSSFFIHSISNDDAETEISDNESSSDSTLIDCSLTNYLIASVEVNIEDLEHPNDSDLEIYLISAGPGRESVTDTLIYQAGGSGDNFIGTKLGDAASISINDGVAPFTGYFKPHEPLSKFNGLSMEGIWILKIYDRASGNEGILRSWSIDFTLSSQPAGIQDITGEIPKGYLLSQNYPNPFNHVTKIKFDIPQNAGPAAQDISLNVYDVRGVKVADLFSEKCLPGTYEISFDGSNLSGGIYYYKLESGNFNSTKKMILLN
jgi:subtilisin-like proprotein convertase family protein